MPVEVGGERGGFIVVLHAEQQRFGLVVDDVLDTQEIVVKPLGRHLKGIPVYAGATILGDGTVVLILDAATLARRSNVLASAGGAATEDAARCRRAGRPGAGGRGRRAAGARRSRWRWSPGWRRSRSTPSNGSAAARWCSTAGTSCRWCACPACSAPTARPPARDGVQLVVYTRGERSVGFVVERILDIATERVGTRSDIDDHGPGGQRRGRRQGGRAARRGVRGARRRPALLHRRHPPSTVATPGSTPGAAPLRRPWHEPALDVPRRQVPVRGGRVPGPGSRPAAADHPGAAGRARDRGPDQPARRGPDGHRPAHPARPAARRTPAGSRSTSSSGWTTSRSACWSTRSAGSWRSRRCPFEQTPSTVDERVRDLLLGAYTLPDRLLLALNAPQVLDVVAGDARAA